MCILCHIHSRWTCTAGKEQRRHLSMLMSSCCNPLSPFTNHLHQGQSESQHVYLYQSMTDNDPLSTTNSPKFRRYSYISEALLIILLEFSIVNNLILLPPPAIHAFSNYLFIQLKTIQDQLRIIFVTVTHLLQTMPIPIWQWWKSEYVISWALTGK